MKSSLRKTISILISMVLILSTNVVTVTAQPTSTPIMEAQDIVIESGKPYDMTSAAGAEAVKGLEEGTIVVRYTSTVSNATQSLFSVANKTNGNQNRHFHIYITPGGTLGFELRNNDDVFKNTGGRVSAVRNTYIEESAVNTIAFRADKATKTYTLFANGRKIDTETVSSWVFIKDITGVDTVTLGGTMRQGKVHYPFGGIIDYVNVYSEALSDEEICAMTADTAYGTLIFNSNDGLNCNYYRIPSLVTLKSGTVVAAVDARYGGTHDSRSNIDTAFAYSTDGGYTWSNPSLVFHFDDYADQKVEWPTTANGRNEQIGGSASFIDPIMVQDGQTGRLYLFIDVMPAGIGSPNAETGNGYKTINGQKYLKLRFHTDGASTYNYSLRDGVIYDDRTGQPTEYTVNADFEVLKNGTPLTVKQYSVSFSGDNLSETKTDVDVAMNVFYKDSYFKVQPTTFIAMKYSDDDGETWSSMQLLNTLKGDNHRYFTTCPGAGTYIENGQYAGRIIIPVYNTQGGGIIYSDDHGTTWQYKLSNSGGVSTTETQIVEMPDGSLKSYSRTGNSYVAERSSTDGGLTWSTATKVGAVTTTSYGTQMSVIRYSGLIDGKPAIILSSPSSTNSRAKGYLHIGLITDTGTIGTGKYTIDWAYSFLVDGTIGYSYSSLAELPDGNIGVIYEKFDSWARNQLHMIDVMAYETYSIEELTGRAVLTYASSDMTMGTVSTDSQKVAIAGSPNAVTATAKAGYEFVKWTSSSNTTWEVAPTDGILTEAAMREAARVGGKYVDTAFTAHFQEKKAVKLSFVSSNKDYGNVSMSEQNILPATGVPVAVVATAESGYKFAGWTVGNRTYKENTLTVDNIRQAAISGGEFVATTFTANFEPLSGVVLTYTSSDTKKGSVSRDSQTLNPQIGVAEAVTAIPTKGYHLASWTHNGVEVTKNELLSSDDINRIAKASGAYVAASFVANFEEDENVVINYVSEDKNKGTVSLDTESKAPVTGTVSGSTAVAGYGYVFIGWYDASGNLVSSSETLVPAKVDGVNVSGTYTARFDKVGLSDSSYSVTWNRLTAAPLSSEREGVYGFIRGNLVEYTVSIKNSSDMTFTMDVSDSFVDSGVFSDIEVVAVSGATHYTSLPTGVGQTVTVAAGDTASVRFAANVLANIDNYDSESYGSKGYENIASITNISATKTFSDGSTRTYTSDGRDGTHAWADSSDGTNLLDDRQVSGRIPTRIIDETVTYTFSVNWADTVPTYRPNSIDVALVRVDTEEIVDTRTITADDRISSDEWAVTFSPQKAYDNAIGVVSQSSSPVEMASMTDDSQSLGNIAEETSDETVGEVSSGVSGETSQETTEAISSESSDETTDVVSSGTSDEASIATSSQATMSDAIEALDLGDGTADSELVDDGVVDDAMIEDGVIDDGTILDDIVVDDTASYGGRYVMAGGLINIDDLGEPIEYAVRVLSQLPEGYTQSEVVSVGETFAITNSRPWSPRQISTSGVPTQQGTTIISDDSKKSDGTITPIGATRNYIVAGSDGTWKVSSTDAQGKVTMLKDVYALDSTLADMNVRFVLSDGSFLADSWALISSDGGASYSWYHLGGDGLLDTGWLLDSTGHWYYLSESSALGALSTGWILDTQDGRWYYLDPSTGSMATGWKQIDSSWYYFTEGTTIETWEYSRLLRKWIYKNIEGDRPYGSMYRDEETPDGYSVKSNGEYTVHTQA